MHLYSASILTFTTQAGARYVFSNCNHLSISIFLLPCLIIILLCNVYMAEDEKAR